MQVGLSLNACVLDWQKYKGSSGAYQARAVVLLRA